MQEGGDIMTKNLAPVREKDLSLSGVKCPICNAPQRSEGWLRWHLKKLHPEREGEDSPASAPARELPPVTYYLRCPFCKAPRTELFISGSKPNYLTCDSCKKVVPTESWLVFCYHNLPLPPAEFRGWAGKLAVGQVADELL